MYFDKDGSSLTLWEWAEKFEISNYKRIGLDEREGIRVSTVWLGLDHAYSAGPPLIFETMVFDDRNMRGSKWLPYHEYPQDLTQERYSTLEQAQEGHARHVKLYLDIMELME